MKARIVKFGSSQGIRIPKLMLERSRLADDVEIEAQDQQIVIRSAWQPRQDWEKAFRTMAKRRDDALLDQELSVRTKRDKDMWKW